MKLAQSALTLFALTLTTAAYAGECTIITTRGSCPGKETETYKPYDGKNPTTETKKADSAADCAKLAEKSSKIIRKGTLKDKKVTAKFDGADVEGGKAWTDEVTCAK